MTYKIEFQKSAAKAFRRLDKQTTEKIRKAIDKLADDPRPFGYKKLVDEEHLYRIRVGRRREDTY